MNAFQTVQKLYFSNENDGQTDTHLQGKPDNVLCPYFDICF